MKFFSAFVVIVFFSASPSFAAWNCADVAVNKATFSGNRLEIRLSMDCSKTLGAQEAFDSEKSAEAFLFFVRSSLQSKLTFSGAVSGNGKSQRYVTTRKEGSGNDILTVTAEEWVTTYVDQLVYHYKSISGQTSGTGFAGAIKDVGADTTVKLTKPQAGQYVVQVHAENLAVLEKPFIAPAGIFKNFAVDTAKKEFRKRMEMTKIRLDQTF